MTDVFAHSPTWSSTAEEHGITYNSNVLINEIQERFLKALRGLAPSAPIHVTSGTRTPESQARAMFTKIDIGDNLYALYNDNFAKGVIDAHPDKEAAAAFIRSYIEGGGVGSRHLRGDGLDIRNRNITSQEQGQLLDAARQLGAKPLVERKPPHIHIGRLEEGAATVSAIGGNKMWLWGGIGLATLAVVWGAGLFIYYHQGE